MRPTASSRRRLRWAGIGVAAGVLAAAAAVEPTESGFTAEVRHSTNSAGTRAYWTCRAAASLEPSNVLIWPLNEPSGTNGSITNLYDATPEHDDGTYRERHDQTPAASSACLNDNVGGTLFAGDNLGGSNSQAISNFAYPIGNTTGTSLTIEVWFRSDPSTTDGIIATFQDWDESVCFASRTHQDRQLFVDRNGRIGFYVNNWPVGGTAKPVTVVSPTTAAGGKDYRDGQWHHLAGTLGAAGQYLYIDGQAIGSQFVRGTLNATINTEGDDNYAYVGSSRAGTFMLACGDVGHFPKTYDSTYAATGTSPKVHLTASLQFAAYYTSQLSAATIQRHFSVGAKL